jgi:hypothetical protein
LVHATPDGLVKIIGEQTGGHLMKGGRAHRKIPREVSDPFDSLLDSAVWASEMGLNSDSLSMWLQWLALAECPFCGLSSRFHEFLVLDQWTAFYSLRQRFAF